MRWWHCGHAKPTSSTYGPVRVLEVHAAELLELVERADDVDVALGAAPDGSGVPQ
jgi:hypothetical protein